MGRGKLVSFLLAAEKWQINLRGVLAQAFSLVIINLKITIYTGVEQNEPEVLCSSSVFKAPITTSLQSYESLTLSNKLAGANRIP